MSKTEHVKCRTNILWLVCFLMLVPAVGIFAEEPAAKSEAGSLLDMSLEELTEITVAGTLTETDPHKIPAGVTTITAEDIAVTPARNLLDLIEIYVPSAMWLSHSSGPQLGIRGIVADRNYKYLILVNGIRVNNSLIYGAMAELSMWDLTDIEKVEIIRGPGSVTYGPGAIAGVISITTKNAKTAPNTEISAFYWDKYMTRGASIGHGHLGKDKEPDVYGYYSYAEVPGLTPDTLFIRASGRTDTGYGQVMYLGQHAQYSRSPAASYLGAFFDEPQIKAHIDVDFKNGWRFWTRYTSGRIPNNTYSDVKYLKDGEWTTFRTNRLRQYVATLENTAKLNEDWNLVSTFNLTSSDILSLTRFINTAGFDNGKHNLRNANIWVSENRWFNRLQFNYDPKTTWKAAFGTEFSYLVIGPGWDRGRHDGFRIGNTISGPGSDAYDPISTSDGLTGPGATDYAPVGHGWKINQHAVFGEVKADLGESWSALVSARVDKHSYTDYMFSPRAALTYEIQPDHFLKAIVQRSVRMNTEEELFTAMRNGRSNKPEKLTTYEVMYQAYAENGWQWMANAFYNENDVIAWSGANRSSMPVGNLRTIGVELEAAFKSEKFDFGANHSFVKQLRWELADGLTMSGISYGDYYQTSSYQTRVGSVTTTYPVTLRSTGNDLSNYANHMTKFFGNVKLVDDKLTLHGDTHIMWGFPGGKDGLDMIRNGGGYLEAADPVLKDKHAYGMLITGNVSLTLHASKSADIAVYVQNIPIYGENKRYTYSSGHARATPEKMAWIEEPMMVGVRFTARF